MSSFFTVPASLRKRKRADQSRGPALKKRAAETPDERQLTANGNKRAERDDSISGSDSDEGLGATQSVSEDESESDEGQTAAERRLKLAERYLDNVREEVDDAGFDAVDVDRDLIAERLKEDAVCLTLNLRPNTD